MLLFRYGFERTVRFDRIEAARELRAEQQRYTATTRTSTTSHQITMTPALTKDVNLGMRYEIILGVTLSSLLTCVAARMSCAALGVSSQLKEASIEC